MEPTHSKPMLIMLGWRAKRILRKMLSQSFIGCRIYLEFVSTVSEVSSLIDGKERVKRQSSSQGPGGAAQATILALQR